MIAVVQKVSEASVIIDKKIRSSIKEGFLILLGITHEDTDEDIEWLSKKVAQLRIFCDEEGKMNLSVQDVKGDIIVVSQFTLHASTKKGNRPSFINAARPEIAIPLYELFVQKLSEEIGKEVQTGEFGADMKVSLINDGPATIIIDTKNRI